MWRQQNTHTLPLSPPTYFPPEPFWRRLTTGQLNGGRGGGKAATRRELWPIETSNKTQAQQKQQLTQSVFPFSSFSPFYTYTLLYFPGSQDAPFRPPFSPPVCNFYFMTLFCPRFMHFLCRSVAVFSLCWPTNPLTEPPPGPPTG